MASIRAGPIIGSSFAVGLAPAAAGCVSRVADVPAGIPEGWPKFLPQSMAWPASQFTNQSDFIHTLSEAEKQEADDALQAFKGKFPKALRSNAGCELTPDSLGT
jgi:hypothetical protein